MANDHPDYEPPRRVAKIILIFGYIMVIPCAIVVFMAIFENAPVRPFLITLGCLLASFIVVAIGYLLRACIDIAENTSQILTILKAERETQDKDEYIE